MKTIVSCSPDVSVISLNSSNSRTECWVMNVASLPMRDKSRNMFNPLETMCCNRWKHMILFRSPG